MSDYKLLDHQEGFEIIDDWCENGMPEGLSTGYPNLDPHFKFKKGQGQLHVCSGYPSSGKSEFIEAIACNMVLKHDWNVTMYCPEKYPIASHQLSLLEKISGKPVIKRGYMKPMTADERMDIEYKVQSKFSLISADEDAYSFETILSGLERRCTDGEKIDMVVLDPWNELENGRPSNITETDYIGLCLRDARRFARKHCVQFFIVAHPQKPQKEKDGTYAVPDLFHISGSGNWRNKADNGFIVHRESLENTRVNVLIRKIKDRFYGKPGTVYFTFQTHNGRYEPAQEEL